MWAYPKTTKKQANAARSREKAMGQPLWKSKYTGVEETEALRVKRDNWVRRMSALYHFITTRKKRVALHGWYARDRFDYQGTMDEDDEQQCLRCVRRYLIVEGWSDNGQNDQR